MVEVGSCAGDILGAIYGQNSEVFYVVYDVDVEAGA
jgi:hypothetical protein